MEPICCCHDAPVRTTLTIEPDVAIEIDRRRRASGSSLKRVINGLLRKGLRAEAEAPTPSPYRSETFDLQFRPGIDSLKLNQLVDDLEVESFVERETPNRP